MPLPVCRRVAAAVGGLHGIRQVAPVFRAGVERKDMHVGMAGNLRQKPQIHRRECGDAEHAEPLRQIRLRHVQPLHQHAPELHAVRHALPAVVQKTPKLRLPDFARIVFQPRRAPARRPCFNPFGAVYQILVKHIGKLSCKLVCGIRAAVQIARQRCARCCKRIVFGKRFRFKQPQKPPAHHFR